MRLRKKVSWIIEMIPFNKQKTDNVEDLLGIFAANSSSTGLD